jgi:hypothetical protein
MNSKEWVQVDNTPEAMKHGNPKGILRKSSKNDDEMFAISQQNTIEFWMNILVFLFFIAGICYLFMSPDSLREG